MEKKRSEMKGGGGRCAPLLGALLLTLVVSCSTNRQNHTEQRENSMKPVSVGSTIPLFELPDQHGATVRIDSLLGRKMLVIYFYPKDDSPGCTKQACYFQDMYEVFREAGAEVIGISGQSVESHRAFAEKYHLSFILLSDAGNRVRRRFGVPADLLGLLPGRVTYVVDRNGTIVYMFDSQTQAERHVDEALRVIREKTGAAATEGGNS